MVSHFLFNQGIKFRKTDYTEGSRVVQCSDGNSGSFGSAHLKEPALRAVLFATDTSLDAVASTVTS